MGEVSNEMRGCHGGGMIGVFAIGLLLCVILPTKEMMIAPVESIIYLGDHATFSCYTSCPNAHQWWEVITNSSYNKQEDHSGSRHDIHISGLKAYATIQCSVFCDVKWSGNASLQIQGLLSTVGNLETDNSISSIILSWSAPFSLDVTDVDPDIWYTVLIYNVTYQENPTAIPCTDCHNLTRTNYTFSPDHPSPCHQYTFTVIPYNGAGQGESSQNVTGYTADFLQGCNDDQAFWHVTQMHGFIYVEMSCFLSNDIMVVIETGSQTFLYIIQNIMSCNTVNINDSAAVVLFFALKEGGLPLSGSRASYVWKSPTVQSLSNEDGYITGDDISVLNFSGSTLSANGAGITVTCTLECAVICLNDNNGLEFSEMINPHIHDIPLRPGSYRCTVLSGGLLNGTLYPISIPEQDGKSKSKIIYATLLVTVAPVVVLGTCIVIIYKKRQRKNMQPKSVPDTLSGRAQESEEDGKGKMYVTGNGCIFQENLQRNAEPQVGAATSINPHGESVGQTVDCRDVHTDTKGEQSSEYVEQSNIGGIIRRQRSDREPRVSRTNEMKDDVTGEGGTCVTRFSSQKGPGFPDLH